MLKSLQRLITSAQLNTEKDEIVVLTPTVTAQRPQPIETRNAHNLPEARARHGKPFKPEQHVQRVTTPSEFLQRLNAMSTTRPAVIRMNRVPHE